MQYLYKENLLDMLGFVKHQIEFIEESTKDVSEVNDLLVTMTGMVLYNSTLMCLQTIGETLKNVDNLTDRKFLSVFYPDRVCMTITIPLLYRYNLIQETGNLHENTLGA